MSDMIRANDMNDFKVYGMPQVSYSVDGVSGRCFGDALIFASIKQATAFEDMSNGYSALVRARMNKAEELGKALSILTEIIASLPIKDGTSSDVVTSNKLPELLNIAAKYDIAINVTGNNQISRANTTSAQNDIQYAIDREDNDINLDMMELKSGMTKRDNAFSQAAEFLKLYSSVSNSVISNMGE